LDIQNNFINRKKNIKNNSKNLLNKNLLRGPTRRKQKIVSKNQIITTGLDELIEVSLNITSSIKKENSSKDTSTELGDDTSDYKNDSYSSSNNDIDISKQKIKDKENLQNLINYIAEKNVINDNDKIKNNFIVKNGKRMKYIKINDHEDRNNKALATLRGCTQMKQLKIAMEI